MAKNKKTKKKDSPGSRHASGDRRSGGKAAGRHKRQKGGRKDKIPPAKKYAFEIASREALLEEIVRAGQPLTHDQLAAVLKIYDRNDKYEALGRRLGAMVRDGQLVRNRRGGFLPVDEANLIRGRVSAHPDGFGFLINEHGGDDIYLSARQMRTVLHGDRVVVNIVGTDRRGRSEGAVIEVLERANKTLVGRLVVNRGIAVLQPDNKRISHEVLVSDPSNAKDGQMVLVEILEQPTNRNPPIASVIEVLGEHMSPGMEIDIAIRSRDIPEKWPDDVMAESAAIGTEVDSSVIGERRDIRSLPLVTIDGEDARDFDDAVYAETRPYGWRLVVAIADVSHYVDVGSALDKEAYVRGTSVYFPQRVIPMLPESLSNGLCSLNPDVDRLCLVADMSITHEGSIKRARFYPATMRSHARLTYTQVGQFLQGIDTPAVLKPYQKELRELHRLYEVMREARAKRGAIEFESVETRIVFNSQRKIEKLLPIERNDAHMLIEECMIAANISAARYLDKNSMPGLYRIHEGPGVDKLLDVRKFLGQRGLSLGGGDQPQPLDYANTLEAARGRSDYGVIQTVMLRSMNQAVYSPRNAGHFGLALEEYAHFTSPIRRYPDLMVHRAIKHQLLHKHSDGFAYNRTRVAEIGDHCSTTERRAEDAVRDVTAWLKCEYMQDQIGSTHSGVISGITSFGAFIELGDIHVEGLLHITSLPHDYYDFESTQHRLVGRRSGRTFELGQEVSVIVAAVNLDERKIDFQLDQSGSKKRKKASTPRTEKGRRAEKARLKELVDAVKHAEPVHGIAPSDDSNKKVPSTVDQSAPKAALRSSSETVVETPESTEVSSINDESGIEEVQQPSKRRAAKKAKPGSARKAKKSSAKKAAAKKKKAAKKKTAAKKKAVKKQTAKKSAGIQKATAKKTSSKKASSKKAVAKKSATKKSSAAKKLSSVKQVALKKKVTSSKKAASKKKATTEKKAVGKKKTTAKKSQASKRKVVAKKRSSKKASSRKKSGRTGS
jgi:ribonuclease R